MKIIVITAENEVEHEIETIHQLFENGLERLHIRKPNWKVNKIRTFIQQMSAEYYDKITIHQYEKIALEFGLNGIHLKSNQVVNEYQTKLTYSKSVHSFEEFDQLDKEFKYAFLSPIFDSISKVGYEAKFEKESLKQFLEKDRIVKCIALGGINELNISKVNTLGFDGAAILGAIWTKKTVKESIETFDKINDFR